MRSAKLLRRVWTLSLAALGLLVFFFAFDHEFSLADQLPGTPLLYLAIVVLAFMAEYVDSSLGMGYGTTLTPLLLILGYTPLQVVPAVLLSEFASGISSGFYHHSIGNVDLGRGTPARKTALTLAACSLGGTLAAVFLAVRLPKTFVTFYIAGMILAIGLYILLARPLGRLSWGRIIGLGSVAAFNKGISGGGYGPLVTGGQILAGVSERNAVGITAFAEGIVCLVGLALYLAMGKSIDLRLGIPLTVGALVSVPAAAWTVKILPERMLRRSIGYATLYIGVLMLIKVAL
jgi:uncharacterized membrane protein YfcA